MMVALFARVTVLAAVGVLVMFSGGLSAQSTPDSLLPARIVQLEDQVRQLQTENAILRGQLAQAMWPQLSEAGRKARLDAEKEAGCPIDWTVTPPVCKTDVKNH